MIRTIAADLPDSHEARSSLVYRYAYSLTLGGQYEEGDIYLRQVMQNPSFKDRVLFLRAHNRLVNSSTAEAGQFLRQIDLDSFAYRDSVEWVLEAIERGPSFARRHKLVSGLLSTCVPGLGQVYAGHYFDAIQSVIFNGTLGQAAYLAWKYDVADRDGGDRRYTLPILATAVWSVFYVANIWNAVNSANRYNRYKERQYFDGMIEKFSIIHSDRAFFLGISVPLNH